MGQPGAGAQLESWGQKSRFSRRRRQKREKHGNAMKGKCPKCLCSSCQRIDWKMIGRYFCKWGVELWYIMDGLTDLECYGHGRWCRNSTSMQRGEAPLSHVSCSSCSYWELRSQKPLRKTRSWGVQTWRRASLWCCAGEPQCGVI